MNPDLSRGFDFALLQQGEIYLRGGNMFVRQHPAHRVNVRSAGKLQDGIRMPEAMKGNVFGDTSSRDPAFERPQQHIAGQTAKTAPSPRGPIRHTASSLSGKVAMASVFSVWICMQ